MNLRFIISTLALLTLGSAVVAQTPPQAATPAKPPTVTEAAPALTAVERLTKLEERLTSKPFVLHFETKTEGLVSSAFKGELALDRGNVATLKADGQFRGTPREIRFSSDGARMRSGTLEETTPPGLNQAIGILTVRLGLSHDLARLSNGAWPEHTDGSITLWIQNTDVADAGIDTLADGRKARKLTFNAVSGGARVAEVELWVDEAANLPLQRKLTVHFQSGVMTVEELYRW